MLPPPRPAGLFYVSFSSTAGRLLKLVVAAYDTLAREAIRIAAGRAGVDTILRSIWHVARSFVRWKSD